MKMIMPNRFIQVKMKDPIRSVYLVETLEDRNNIPVTARYEGMLVYVKEDRGNYQLQGGIENDDRGELVGGGVAGKGIYKIELIDTVGLEKIYRISFTDNTHFDYVVTDGNDGESASDILMQYSADNTIWNDVFTAGDKYIRFSTDGGDTYGEGFKFIGEDGTPGQDGDPGQDGVSIVDVYVDGSDLVFKYSDDSTTQIDNFRSVFNIPTDVSDLTDTTGLISGKEDSANKVTDLLSNDNVHFPTTKAVNTELDKKVDKDGTKVLSDENFTTDMKDKLAGLEGSHYRGLFTSLLDLTNTITDAIPGDYADVDEGVGKDVMRYIWDDSDDRRVEQGGSVGITGAEVKTLYESNLDTNAFTDDEKSKLSQIEAKAQKNVQANWNETDSGNDGFILNKPSLDIKDLPDSTNLKTTWNNKQNALGFTPENVDNKSGDIEPNKTSTTKYPTIKGIYDWVVSKLAGKANSSHTHTKAEVGLGNVDNTSDINKPISTATQTALNGKSDSSHTHTIADVTNLQTSLDAKANQSTTYTKTETDTKLGTKANLVDGKIPASELPSYVDDVVEASNQASLPATGEAGKIYITTDNNKVFRRSGTAYLEIVASPGSTDAVPEGATNKYFTEARAKSALATELAGKANSSHTHTKSQITDLGPIGDMSKSTYDPNNIADDAFSMDNMVEGANTKILTSAERTKLSNTSGTNTGDETTTTLGSKINGADAKTTPVDADMVGLMDSAAGNILKKLSWSNIKATLKTYFDTLYQTILTKASGSDVDTGTDDAKFVTSKAIKDSKLSYTDGTETLTNKTITDAKTIQSINAQSGTTYTFVLTDASKIVTGNNEATQTYTIPTNDDVAFPVGTQIDIVQIGAGKITLAGTDVTINSKGGNKSTGGQWVGVSIIKTATNTWLLIGDLIS